MKENIVRIIQLLSVFSVVAPVIFYFVKFRISPRQNHIIGSYIILCAAFDILITFQLLPNSILYNGQDVFQFIILTWFYYELVYKKRSDLVMLVTIGTYIAVLLTCIFYQGIFKTYSFLWTTGSVIISIHALVYIFNVPRMVVDRYFDNNFFSNLIFNASLLFYFSMTILIFFVAESIFASENTDTIKAFWSVHNMLNIVKNIGLAIGFYYTGKRQIYMTMTQLEKIAKRLEEEGDY